MPRPVMIIAAIFGTLVAVTAAYAALPSHAPQANATGLGYAELAWDECVDDFWWGEQGS